MSVAGFSVRNWQFTLVVFCMLVALGINAWITTPRAEDPAFDAPNFWILAIYPGASPQDLERLVVEPLEERVAPMADLKKLRSNINDSATVIIVEFEVGVDPSEKFGELQREVAEARDELPAGLMALEVRQFRPSEVAVFQYALVAPNAPWAEIRAQAETIERAIEDIPGVGDAVLHAMPKDEIHVDLDPAAANAAGVPIGQMIQAIQGSSVAIPGGFVDAGDRRFNVALGTDFARLDDISDTPIGGGQYGVVRVGDVATVTRGTSEDEHLARFNGERAMWITISFAEDVNLFDVGAAVEARMTELGQALPEGMRLAQGFDQTNNVGRRLQGFMRDFALAIGLVLITLLPLGVRASAVVMLSIPLSVLCGLAMLAWAGYSINQLSIVGFVIALGLLVDDSIVVVENIARHLREGARRSDAAIAATDQITLAVLGCTATLIFAFLPLLFLPGTAGMFIRSLPLAVVFTIVASLVVSLTIVPLLSSLLLSEHEGPEGNAVLRAVNAGIEGSYRRVLETALYRPKLTVVLAAALFAGSLALVPSLGFSLFPKAGLPQFRVVVDTGDGASLARTDAVMRQVETELLKHPEITAVMSNVGRGNPRVYYNVFPAEPRNDTAEALVMLDRYDADRTPALLDELRRAFDAIPGTEIGVFEFENGPPVDAPVAIRLVSEDLDALSTAAARVEQLLLATPGTEQVVNPLRVSRTDLRVEVDRAAAANRGVVAGEVARAVRMALAGLEVGRFREEDGTEKPIQLRVAGTGRPTLDRVEQLRIDQVQGGSVPLGEIAEIGFEASPSVITHFERDRSTLVTSFVRTGETTDAVTRRVLAALATLELPEGVIWQAAGEVEARDESFAGLGTAAIVAAFGVLAVLVLEFKTFKSTVVVASVIPLGIIGGLLGLYVTDNTISFTASIGFVALMGIEVKNSILLVDFTNQLRAEGLDLDAAIARAGEIRFLPILLTTATALGGLVPLAVEGNALYSPLAIVIIGGLISSTILTRVVTPVMYKLFAPAVEGAT